VSQLITVENIDAVSRIVQRGVTIWDNLHANDYDQTRLYLGPYSGRDSRLTAKLRGVLTNPNCEFEANFIAMHSLAQWSVNKCTRFIQHNSGM
jgi:protein O-GlcNAcase/histone acetyltransferase